MRFALLLLGCAAACSHGSGPAADGGAADLAAAATGDFANPTRVTIVGWSDDAMEPFLSRDGRYLLFNNSNDPSVDTNLHFAERVDDLTFQYRGPIGGVNTTSLDAVASEDDAGTFYFISTRSYSTTQSTIYRGAFVDGNVSGVALVGGVPALGTGHVIFDAVVSADGGTLAFAEGVFDSAGGPRSADIVLANGSAGGAFARVPNSAVTLQAINLPGGIQYAPLFSASKLELYFTRLVGTDATIFGASRASTSAPFDAPRALAAISGFAEAPTLSVDEKSLYYHAHDPANGGKLAIYRVTRP
jgi:hypothetical protein